MRQEAGSGRSEKAWQWWHPVFTLLHDCYREKMRQPVHRDMAVRVSRHLFLWSPRPPVSAVPRFVHSPMPRLPCSPMSILSPERQYATGMRPASACRQTPRI